MARKSLVVAGVMSGTSVDALDVAIVKIDADVHAARLANVATALLGFTSVPWSSDDRARMMRMIHRPDDVTLREVGRVNRMIADRTAAAVMTAISAAGLTTADVHLIASHGQTVFHDPPVSTIQLGDPSTIAVSTGIPTVGDFRVADVAAGGQGAPLTSTMDVLCLCPKGDADKAAWRAVQNIGGIGNVTFVPHEDSGLPPIAFDTGPGNVWIDLAAGKVHALETGVLDERYAYDKDGKLAQAGTVCEPLLTELLALPYLALPPPKTTGRELFTKDAFDSWWEKGVGYGASPTDLVATFTEFTARTIADAYNAFGPAGLCEVIVGGGGARNPVLMRRIESLLNTRKATGDARIAVATHEDVGVSSAAKEAIAFALLGYMAFFRVPNNIPSCTGASKPVVMGKLCYP